MKRKSVTISLLLGLLMLGACGDDPVPIPEPSAMMVEAGEFSRTIILTFLEDDAATYKASLGTTLYFLEPWEEPVATAGLDVAGWFDTFDYTAYDINDFAASYTATITPYAIYKDYPGIDELTYWTPDSEDYLFTAPPVEGANHFMFEDMLVFMVSKRTGTWKIRATGG